MRARGPIAAAILAGTLGVLAAIHFRAQGIHLSHSDAAARALVARRVLDYADGPIAPVGLAWLPLPALLEAIPSLDDDIYRDGIAGTALSILGLMLLAASGYVLGRLVTAALRSSGSSDFPDDDDHRIAELGGAATAAAVTLVPSVLYVAATPLIENFYCGLAVAAVSAVTLAVTGDESERRALYGGAALCGAAALVRYDAWPLVVYLAAMVGLLRRSVRDGFRFLAVSGAPVIAFVAYATVRTGFPPRLSGKQPGITPSLTSGSLVDSVAHLLHGAATTTGAALLVLGFVGTALLVWRCRCSRDARRVTIPLLGLWGAFPSYAWMYYAGHPFRGRYALLLVPALAVGAIAAAAFCQGRRRVAALAAVVALVVGHLVFPVYGAAFWTSPRSVIGRHYGWVAPRVERTAAVYGLSPRRWFTHDVMLFELTRDLPYTELQYVAAEELVRRWDGRPVLSSLASCAPVIFRTGFPLTRFLVENDPGWQETLARPPGDAGWVLGWTPDRVTERVAESANAGVVLEPVLELERWRLWRRHDGDDPGTSPAGAPGTKP